MAKPNYHHVRRQKELARKMRQQAKQQRKAAARSAPRDPEPAAEK